ncbi:helix-turn-helix domain-containing protein, partial [Acidocella sp. KAb 2-4]|uniref:helix-turn-helix domain-containing protein n=1 Tax=Acidocella sp. KAb 2-4 TaxID=2885158 RepID=UPI001D069B42
MAESAREKAAPGKARVIKAPLPQALAEAGLPAFNTGSSAAAVSDLTLEQAIGVQVRQLRRRVGITVSELAASAGLSGGMLSKIENGQISPSLSSLQ